MAKKKNKSVLKGKYYYDDDVTPEFQSKEGSTPKPEKLHTIKITSEVHKALQELLNETGANLDELIIDLILERRLDLVNWNMTKAGTLKKDKLARNIPKPPRKTDEQRLNKEQSKRLLEALDEVEKHQGNAQKLEDLASELKKRREQKNIWIQRVGNNKNRPTKYVSKIQKMEVFIQIAHLTEGEINLEELKVLKPEKFGKTTVNSTRKNIYELYEGQLVKWGLISHGKEKGLFPEWEELVKDGRIEIPRWQKIVNNILLNLKNDGYIYQNENKEWYVVKEALVYTMLDEDKERKKQGLTFYPHTFQGLAKLNDFFSNNETEVSKFYETNVNHFPFSKTVDEYMKNKESK